MASASSGGAVQLLVHLALDAVFLAADDPDLHLHHDAGLGALVQQLGRDLQVLVQRHRGPVPHVRLEQRLLTAGDPLLGQRDQRAHEAVELVLRAVVGVQRDVDRVLGRDDVGELGEGGRAGDHVLDALARRGTRRRRWTPGRCRRSRASANPRRAAFSVWLEVTLIAG